MSRSGATVARYHFVTDAWIGTSRERAWDLMEDPRTWPSWWTWLRSVELLRSGDDGRVGDRHRWRFRTALPYTVTVTTEVVRSRRPALAELRASGDLAGTGLWQLHDDGDGMHVRWTWVVDTTKRWMDVASPVGRPVFAWNHDVLMRAWAREFAGALDAPLLHHEHRSF
jgi:hypothetical protein